MSRLPVLLFLAAAFAAPTTLAAQEDAYKALLGEWEMTQETPRGTMTQQFVFTLDGGELKGTVTSRMGTFDLTNVKFEEGKLTFDVERSFRDRSFTQSFTATIDGSEMKGTMSGGRRGDRPFTAARKET
jgi:hypothetical protein